MIVKLVSSDINHKKLVQKKNENVAEGYRRKYQKPYGSAPGGVVEIASFERPSGPWNFHRVSEERMG